MQVNFTYLPKSKVQKPKRKRQAEIDWVCNVWNLKKVEIDSLRLTANHILDNVSKKISPQNYFILKMTNIVNFGGTWFVFFHANNALCTIISVKYLMPINFPTLDIEIRNG